MKTCMLMMGRMFAMGLTFVYVFGRFDEANVYFRSQVPLPSTRDDNLAKPHRANTEASLDQHVAMHFVPQRPSTRDDNLAKPHRAKTEASLDQNVAEHVVPQSPSTRDDNLAKPHMSKTEASLDQNVAEHVVLQRPSTRDYNLAHPDRTYYSQWGQDKKMWKQFLSQIDGLKKNGYKPFFIESGAYDGEGDSNSLFLEKTHGWSGLLVEPSPHYKTLLGKHRKAWSFNGALSPTGNSGVAVFEDVRIGQLSHLRVEGFGPRGNTIRVPTHPVATLLQSIEPPVQTVDFWSFDIEGSEAPVLEHTDFDKVEIGTLMIEMNKGQNLNVRIRRVLKAKGFLEVGGTSYNEGPFLDRVFVNPKYFNKRGLKVPVDFGVVRM